MGRMALMARMGRMARMALEAGVLSVMPKVKLNGVASHAPPRGTPLRGVSPRVEANGARLKAVRLMLPRVPAYGRTTYLLMPQSWTRSIRYARRWMKFRTALSLSSVFRKFI